MNKNKNQARGNWSKVDIEKIKAEAPSPTIFEEFFNTKEEDK